MNTKKLLQLSVLAFGMFLLSEALSTTSFILADERYHSSGFPYAIASTVILSAIIMTLVLYLYVPV